jgi:hypothetical protein
LLRVGRSGDLIPVEVRFSAPFQTNPWGPTQPPVQWVTILFSTGLKRPGRGVDYPHNLALRLNKWYSNNLCPPLPLFQGEICLSKYRQNVCMSVCTLIHLYQMSIETQSVYRCVVSTVCVVTNAFRTQNLIQDRCCNVCSKTLFHRAVGDAELKDTVVYASHEGGIEHSSPLSHNLDTTWR